MYHGIGCEEHDPKEIAEYLNVNEGLAREYIHDTPQSDEIDKALDELAKQTRKDVIMDLRARLRDLNELEEELKDAVEVVVTDFAFEQVELEVQGAPGDGVGVSEDANATYNDDVPVPNRVKEVPQFDRLQKVWEEKTRVQDQLTNLLGMAEPDEVEVSGDLDVTEQKVYSISDDEDNEYPEQEVSDVEEADSL